MVLWVGLGPGSWQVVVVPMRVNVNRKVATVEDLVARRKATPLFSHPSCEQNPRSREPIAFTRVVRPETRPRPASHGCSGRRPSITRAARGP